MSLRRAAKQNHHFRNKSGGKEIHIIIKKNLKIVTRIDLNDDVDSNSQISK